MNHFLKEDWERQMLLDQMYLREDIEEWFDEEAIIELINLEEYDSKTVYNKTEKSIKG
jgi:hypothetical protein